MASSPAVAFAAPELKLAKGFYYDVEAREDGRLGVPARHPEGGQPGRQALASKILATDEARRLRPADGRDRERPRHEGRREDPTRFSAITPGGATTPGAAGRWRRRPAGRRRARARSARVRGALEPGGADAAHTSVDARRRDAAQLRRSPRRTTASRSRAACGSRRSRTPSTASRRSPRSGVVVDSGDRGGCE